MQGQQNNRGEYRVGPGASSLLLIFVAVCLTTIGILMLLSALADRQLSVRSNAHVVSYYDAAAQVQREIGTIDGRLSAARKQAAGDVEVYRGLIDELNTDPLDIEVNDADEEDAKLITFHVPMDETNRIECDLLVPVAVDGPRYEVARHVAVNVSDWVPDENMDLFTVQLGDDVVFPEGDSVGGIFDDESFDDEESEDEETDVEEDAEDHDDEAVEFETEDSGIVGEGQSIESSDEG